MIQRPRRPRASHLVALAALAGLGCLTGCTGAATVTTVPTTAGVSSERPTPTPTPTLTPSPATPTPTPTPELRSPLNGQPTDTLRPVLVVKLDNTQYAQPHAGLVRADLVYMEEVEYGITRLAAVFSTHVPERIGPVRSARITDVELLAQYDQPAFAFSGAQRKLLPVLAAAPFHDVSPNKCASAYARDYNRRAPYNLYLNGQTGLSCAPKAGLAKDMGFAFDESVPTGGLVAKSATIAWSYASAAFRYEPETGHYAVTLNGRRAGAEENDRGQNAATVVIQYVKQRPSVYFDKGGGNTPQARTVGTGKAIVMRDGLAWQTTWSRPTAESGTTFALDDGTVLPFKPGQTWIVLLDSKRKAVVKPLTEPMVETATPTPTAAVSPSS